MNQTPWTHYNAPGNETLVVEKSSGLVMPWLTRPCLMWLSKQELGRVFEWGCGLGSEWLRRRAANYVGVEHQEQFVGPGVVCVNCDGLDERDEPGCHHPYCSHIGKVGPQDTVIIDGHFRQSCAMALVRVNWKPATIIVDNANWPTVAPLLSLFPKMNVQAFWDIDHADWLTVVLSNKAVL